MNFTSEIVPKAEDVPNNVIQVKPYGTTLEENVLPKSMIPYGFHMASTSKKIIITQPNLKPLTYAQQVIMNTKSPFLNEMYKYRWRNVVK